MRISIFGVGYVGTVTGACLAKMGHTVIGVDINQVKVAMINRGRSPIVENGLDEIVEEARRLKRLSATVDTVEAVRNSEISMVCVGTPSSDNGSINLRSAVNVCKDIGLALRKKSGYHIIVVRSTILPGSLEHTLIPAIERASKRSVHKHFGICINPEFMREGNAVQDFLNPPFTIIGGEKEKDTQKVKSLYKKTKAPLIITDYRSAQTIKYASNIFHALKITFANEIGSVCASMGVDPLKVMELFSQDTKLNISPAYLRPGFAFGGSCLPKDIQAILYKAKISDLHLPLISSILLSNQAHRETVFQKILALKRRKTGLIGLGFKVGTDDLRESPLVNLCEFLLGKGFELKIFDEKVVISKLAGANKRYIETIVPHLTALLVPDLKALIKNSGLIIIGNPYKGLDKLLLSVHQDQIVMDLTEQYGHLRKKIKGRYYSIFQ